MAGLKQKISIYDQFECSGADCPESCCTGSWSIDVDTKTYEKWQALADNELRTSIMDSVVYSEASQKFWLRSNSEGNCTQLAQGLCKIQSSVGHDYLPETCRRYPRVHQYNNLLAVDSLSLSCPEVLRLLGEREGKKARLWLAQSALQGGGSGQSEQTIDESVARHLLKMVNETISFDQYQANIQLFHIGAVLCRIAELSMAGNLGKQQLKGACGKNRERIYQAKRQAEKPMTDNDRQAWMNLLGLAYKVLSRPEEILLDVDHDSLADLMRGLKQDDLTADEALYPMLLTMRDNARGLLPASYSAFMQTYIAVKFKNNAFPVNPVQGNAVAGFLYCVIPFVLIQVLVWLQARQNKALSEDDIQTIVYRVERELDHNQKIYEYMNNKPDCLNLDNYLKGLLYV